MKALPTRREFLKTAGATALGLGASPALSLAQQLKFFRIATGSAGGTYFPIGGLIANAISNPPGSRPCERGGSCGIPGVIAVAQSTHGSVENVRLIDSGMIESGFCQADVAYWAFNGSEIFGQQGPLAQLRFLANLYPESVHLVVRRNAGMFRIQDLKGKRISIDRDGSGTQVDAKLILAAFGLGEGDVSTVSVSAGEAARLLSKGELDGFFFVAGAPASVISALAEESLISLIPIEGPEVDELRANHPFFAVDRIPAGVYSNVAHTPTLSVGAQWLVGSNVPEETVHDLSLALWHENTRRLLDSGHPKGRLIQLETALVGLGIPLHPGAARFYADQGLSLPDPLPESQESQ